MPLTQVDQGLLGQYAQYTGFKNRIINGAMVIDQRNAGAAVTGANAFPIDRFITGFSFDGVVSAQRSTVAPAGFTNSLGFTVTTPDTSIGAAQFYGFRQRIEGFNTADLGWGAAGAQTVTLSFWVRSSITGTYGITISNSADSRLYPTSYTVNSANTWEQKIITVPGDTTGTWLTDNGIGIQVQFYLALGSNFQGTTNAWTASAIYGPTGMVNFTGTNGATFYITGVQLEKGSTATSFDYRPYGTELALCQRYCQKFNVFPTSNFDAFQSYFGGSNALSSVKRLTTPMRATPTAAFTNAGVEYYSFGGAWTATTLNSSITTNEMYYIFCASDGDGRGKLMRNGSGGSSGDPVVTFSAEL